MAANMDALLRIKAAVTGNESVAALGKTFNQVQSAAVGLTKAGGLAGSALGALAPIVTIGGLTALVGSTIKTADSMHDLSLRTGVSVEMLGKFGKAAKMSGSSLDAVVLGIGRLQKAMVAAASSNTIGQKTKEEIDEAVNAVREGERTQTRLIKDQADQRVSVLERETDRRMKEIDSRYRREEQLLNDSWDDQADAADKAAEKQVDNQIRIIQRQYDARRKAIQDDESLSDQAKTNMLQKFEDQESAELDVIRDGASKKTKERQRAARDAQQAVTDQLNDRKERETRIIKDQIEREKEAIKAGADYRIEQVKRTAEEAATLLKGAPKDELAEQMQELGLSGKGASKIFRELNIDIKNADGTLRPVGQVMLSFADALAKLEDPAKRTAYAMQLLGRGGAELVPGLSQGGAAIEKIKVGMTTKLAEIADQYSDSLINLSGAVGKLAIPLVQLLLPGMTMLSEGMVVLVRGFSSLPGPVQSVASVFAVAAIAATGLAAALAPLGILLMGLAGAGVKTSIVGSLGGVLTWIGSTFVPAMLAFFSGPAGWITLAVIAVGAMVFAFREPIGQFFSWLGEQIGGFVKALGDLLGAIGKTIYDAVDTINKGIRDAIKGLWDWASEAVGNVAEALAAPFVAGADAIKGVLRGVLQFGANVINSFLNAINQMIGAVNSVAGRLSLPTLPTFGTVSVPSFEGGGYTGNAPRVGGIDGRGGFPAILHPREMVIDQAKARAGGASSTPTSITIPITTGPVYRLPDGTDAVSMSDLEGAMQSLANGIMNQLGTPAGRMMLRGA